MPKHESTVNKGTVQVGGTYSPKTAEDIWVLLLPEQAPETFYPQSNDARQGLPATK